MLDLRTHAMGVTKVNLLLILVISQTRVNACCLLELQPHRRVCECDPIKCPHEQQTATHTINGVARTAAAAVPAGHWHVLVFPRQRHTHTQPA
jgi:hypothetical protein